MKVIVVKITYMRHDPKHRHNDNNTNRSFSRSNVSVGHSSSAAFAQVGNIATDDDIFAQANEAEIRQHSALQTMTMTATKQASM